MPAINIPAFYRRLGEKQDKILDDLDGLHIETLDKALKRLETDVIKSLSAAPTKGGVLWDTKWAIQFRTELKRDFDKRYHPWAHETVDGYNEAAKGIKSLYGELNLSSDFTKVEKEVVRNLKKQYFSGFQDLGNRFVSEMADATYQSVLTGRRFEDLVTDLQQSINGVYIQNDETKQLVEFVDKYRDTPELEEQVAAAIEKLHTVYAQDMIGRNIRRYASQMVHDSLMQFNGTFTRTTAKEAGIDSFMYYGSLVKDSRSFCANHAGKVYTTEQAEKIWDTQQWKGKSGTEPFIDRGGFNCRHHWVPVSPEHLSSLQEMYGADEPIEIIEPEKQEPEKAEPVQAVRLQKFATIESVVEAGARDDRYIRKEGKEQFYYGHGLKKPERMLGKVSLDNLSVEARGVVTSAVVDAQNILSSYGLPPIRAVRTRKIDAAASMGEGILTLNDRSMNRRASPLSPKNRKIMQEEGKTFLFAQRRIDEIEKELPSLEGRMKGRAENKLKRYKKDSAVSTIRMQEAMNNGINISSWEKGQRLGDRPYTATQFYSRPEDQIRSTIFHEAGHHVHQMLDVRTEAQMFKAPFDSEIKKKYSKKLFHPTRYSEVDHQEWFAENFSLYHMGKKELVDAEAIKLINQLEKRSK